MKKLILSLSFLLIGSIATTAQIGINTQNPQGSFHVDGAKDNAATGAPTVAQQNNDLIVTSTGNVGIGTTTPDPSASLEVRATNKGFLPPKLTLISDTDNVTVTNPSTGLTVYHFGIPNMEAGLYTNVGTPSSPKWTRGSQSNTTIEGSKIYKSVYRGRNVAPYDTALRPNVVVPEINLMFRFAVESDVMRLQVRLINPPTLDVKIRLLGHWQSTDEVGQLEFYRHGSLAQSVTFTPNDYSTWQSFGGNWSGEWGYYYLIYTDEIRTGTNNPYNHAMNLYGIDSYGFYGTAIEKELYSLAAEVF